MSRPKPGRKRRQRERRAAARLGIDVETYRDRLYGRGPNRGRRRSGDDQEGDQ